MEISQGYQDYYQNEMIVPHVFFQKDSRRKKSKIFNDIDISQSHVSYLANNYRKNTLRRKITSENNYIKTVECRVEFLSFGQVDTFNEQFKAHVLIRSRWSVDEIMTEYNPKKDWNPKLFVENAIPEKFYEEINYKLEKFDNKTEITEVRSCKGFDQIFFFKLFY